MKKSNFDKKDLRDLERIKKTSKIFSPTSLRILCFASVNNITLKQLEEKVGIARKNLLVHIKEFEKRGMAKRKKIEGSREYYLKIDEKLEEIFKKHYNPFDIPENEKREILVFIYGLSHYSKNTSLLGYNILTQKQKNFKFIKNSDDFYNFFSMLETLGLIQIKIDFTKYGQRLVKEDLKKTKSNKKQSKK